jgi:hypothetical protein
VTAHNCRKAAKIARKGTINVVIINIFSSNKLSHLLKNVCLFQPQVKQQLKFGSSGISGIKNDLSRVRLGKTGRRGNIRMLFSITTRVNMSFTGAKRPGSGVNNPLTPSAEVEEKVQLYFIPPLCFHDML